MTLIEIIYAVTIGAGTLVGIAVIFAFIANIFKSKPQKEVKNETKSTSGNIRVNSFQMSVTSDLFNAYLNALILYPEFINYIKTKEKFPLNFDRREIVRSH